MTDLLEQRYGARRPVRRALLVAVLALLAVVALAWVAWAAWFQSTPDVDSSLASYDVVDAHRADATVAVRLRTPRTQGSCLLRATAFDHTVVGELNFAVPRNGRRTVTTEQTLRTERRATAVELVGCTAPGQVRPR